MLLDEIVEEVVKGHEITVAISCADSRAFDDDRRPDDGDAVDIDDLARNGYGGVINGFCFGNEYASLVDPVIDSSIFEE